MQTINGKVGYACIDMTSKNKFKTCRKKTFQEQGLSHISDLCVHNANHLKDTIDNNIKDNILMYRISSNLMPWFHLYEIEELPDYEKIISIYKEIGNVVKQSGMRISFHPDHFTVLASQNPKTIEQSIKDMNHHSFIMDLMDAPKNTNAKINIHISNTKPDKATAIKRFIEVFKQLDETTQQRTTIENDDNKNGYTVEELYSVYEEIGTPIVFDTLHYQCNKGNLSYEEALNKCCSTWGEVTPTAHHSSSKTKEDSKSRFSAHSDYLFEPFEYCGNKVDVMLEAKGKNLALKKYYEDYCVS